jgi:hypothetical protein
VDTASVGGVLDSWHAANPRIRRACAFGMQGEDAELHVLVDLEPVMDSEETVPVWLSCADRWEGQLRARTARTVHLAWMEPHELVMLAIERGAIALPRIWVSEAIADAY